MLFFDLDQHIVSQRRYDRKSGSAGMPRPISFRFHFLFGFGRIMAFAASNDGPRFEFCSCHHPRTYSVRLFDVIDFLQKRKKNFLKNVCRLFVVESGTTRYSEDQSLIPSHQLIPSCLIAVSTRSDQLGVVEVDRPRTQN